MHGEEGGGEKEDIKGNKQWEKGDRGVAGGGGRTVLIIIAAGIFTFFTFMLVLSQSFYIINIIIYTLHLFIISSIALYVIKISYNS